MQTQRATTNTVSKTHQLHTGTIPMFLRLINNNVNISKTL